MIEKLDLGKIKGRVMALTRYLIQELLSLKHFNGQPLVKLIGSPTVKNRGGNIAFVLVDPLGNFLDEERVEELAKDAKISFRTGCFCNPGVGEFVFGIAAKHLKFLEGFTDEQVAMIGFRKAMRQQFGPTPLAAIRISFGLASNFRDAYYVLSFLKSFVDKSSSEVGGLLRILHPTVAINKVEDPGIKRRAALVPILRNLQFRKLLA